MAAISFVNSTRSPSSYPSGTNNTSTCDIAKPSGTTTGDVMLVFLESGGGNPSFSYPTGWREVSKYANTSANMTSAVAYKIATSSEPSSYTFGDSQGGATPLCGMVLTYRGVAVEDPVSDPINATAESNTGTTGTTSVAAPTATSTALGWYVWFRAGKISTTNPSENTFNVTDGTARQLTSNRGGSTGYFVMSADSSGLKDPGANTGATFSRTGAGTFSGSLARTIVLKMAVDPPMGPVAMSLEPVTMTGSGTQTNPASIFAILGKVGVAGAATHYPPAVGPFGVSVGPVQVSIAASGVGGPLAASLPPVTASGAASVNPIGAMAVQLAPVTVTGVSETRLFGRNVILVEPEKRALRITQYDMIPIYKSEVAFEPLASPFSITLEPIEMSAAAETTYGFFNVALRPVTASGSGTIIWGDFEVGLAPVSASATGATVGGELVAELRGVTATGAGFRWVTGALDVGLPPLFIAWSDSPAGPMSMTLEPVTADGVGAIVGGNFDGIQLWPVTAEFNGAITTEDIVKYAASVGDGTATSYTVTHNAGTRDVVVGVYDNSTYEEVVPLTVHATTNTVTVQFATAPASDAYRVVVLWSST